MQSMQTYVTKKKEEEKEEDKEREVGEEGEEEKRRRRGGEEKVEGEGGEKLPSTAPANISGIPFHVQMSTHLSLETPNPRDTTGKYPFSSIFFSEISHTCICI